MTVFPQLSSGAVAQFPFRKELRFRTLVNQAADGSEIRFADVDYQARAWELAVHQLSDQEWQSIEDLHNQVEGRLQTFLFLEPGANLLAWSERFSNAVWQKSGGVSALDAQPDPVGGSSAGQLTNPGPAGTVSQVISAPASFRYAGSVWARTADSGAKLQVGDTASQVVTVDFDTSNQWKRYSVGYNLSSGSESVSFEVAVPVGATVDIYGPQLEAQPAPSAYKKTFQQAGIYPNARFDSDVLADRAMGVSRHSGVIRIVWAPLPT